MAGSVANPNNTVFQSLPKVIPYDNTSVIAESSSKPLSEDDRNQKIAILAQRASSLPVGIDALKPDITEPVSERDPILLSKQMSLLSQSVLLTPAQNEKVSETPKEETVSRSESIKAATKFLGGNSSNRVASLIELAKTALLSKHVELGMKTNMLEKSQQSLEKSVDHSIQAAREQLKKDLTSATVTSVMALTGGVKSYQGYSHAIKGYQIQGTKITDHKALSDGLDAQAMLSRTQNMSDSTLVHDRNGLRQSANSERVKAETQQNQLQMTLSASQQQIGVGQALQSGALAMGTLSSSPMIMSQAEENGQQQLRQFDKDVFMQESQRNDERAQDAEKLKSDLLATLENIMKGNSDTASVVANNTKM